MEKNCISTNDLSLSRHSTISTFFYFPLPRHVKCLSRKIFQISKSLLNKFVTIKRKIKN